MSVNTFSNSPEYAQNARNWRAMVITLYEGRCFVTGTNIKDGEPFEAHHLYCRSAFPEKSLDSNNGVLLKKEINQKFHQLYYGIAVTPKHFNEFLKETYNIDSFPWENTKAYE